MKKGILLILLTALISGISIFLNAFGIKGIDPTIFTFSKNIIVGLFLLAIILGLKEIKSLKNLTKKNWLQLLTIGLVGGSIPFILFFTGLKMSSGATGSFIHKTMFIFVAILAMFFLKEKLSKKILIPASLLLIGNYLLLKLTFPEFNLGTIFIFLATLFWAGENIISKHALKELSGNVVAFGRMFFGSLFILIYMAFTNKVNLLTTLTSSQMMWIAITSIFLIGFVITYYNGLKTTKVTTATSILLLGSPITTLFQLFFLGKAITALQIMGLVIIALGVTSMILITEKQESLTKVRQYRL